MRVKLRIRFFGGARDLGSLQSFGNDNFWFFSWIRIGKVVPIFSLFFLKLLVTKNLRGNQGPEGDLFHKPTVYPKISSLLLGSRMWRDEEQMMCWILENIWCGSSHELDSSEERATSVRRCLISKRSALTSVMFGAMFRLGPSAQFDCVRTRFLCLGELLDWSRVSNRFVGGSYCVLFWVNAVRWCCPLAPWGRHPVRFS